MKKRVLLLSITGILMLPAMDLSAQVAINTDGSLPDTTAILDIQSTSKGMLIPRMTLAERDAIISPAMGLTVFQTDFTPGIYFNSGTSGSPVWVMAGTGGFWNLTGNAGTTVGTNFLGTTNGQPLMFKVNNQKSGYIDYASPFNTSFGYQSLNSSIYSYNSAFGYQALFSNTIGYENTANGYQALYSNTEGWENTANGLAALYSNTTGYRNTTNGYSALTDNTTGYSNTANGFMTLYSNTIGYENTANGHGALYSNVAGNSGVAIGYNSQTYANDTGTPWDNTNTSIGYQSLMGSATPANNTGTNNTAVGRDVLISNSSGSNNTATGMSALFSNTVGSYNTAYGQGALYNNVAGYFSVAIGYNSQSNVNNTSDPWDNTNTSVGCGALKGSATPANNEGTDNTAIGRDALYSNDQGWGNTAIGYSALFSNTGGSANTAIGETALYSNTIGAGNTATGAGALYHNVSGISNTAIGDMALYSTTGSDNTAIGNMALYLNTGGNNNTAVGIASGPTSGYPNLNNTTSIGYNTGFQGADNQVNIGNMSVSWIGGEVGWNTYSDSRIKDNVTANVPGLSFITLLRPVTYNLNIHKQNEIVSAGNDKKEEGDWATKYDIEKMRMTGFIAQDVEQAAREANYDFSGITVPKKSNELYTLSYEQFVVPLVKAVQELDATNRAQQLKIEKQELKIEEQQQAIDILKKQNEQILARIEKLESK